MEEQRGKEIIKRLDLMVVLLMKLISDKDEEPIMKKVKLLRDLNFTNEEIGIYLNKAKDQVAKLLYENKRKTKRQA